MPEMVFSLCKLAREEKSIDELQRLLTLGDQNSADLFSKLLNFSDKCGFIVKTSGENRKTVFTDEQLNGFSSFRYALFMEVFKDNESTFTKMAKWYLSLSIPKSPQKGESIFGVTTAAGFLAVAAKNFNVSENYCLGFRFWMTALGLTAFNPSVQMPLTFAAHRIIKEWLFYSKPCEVGVLIPARSFFERLVKDCPVFSACISENTVSDSLSSALRVLDDAGIIRIRRVTDSGDLWHLSKSVIYSNSNDFTDIQIMEVSNEHP